MENSGWKWPKRSQHLPWKWGFPLLICNSISDIIVIPILCTWDAWELSYTPPSPWIPYPLAIYWINIFYFHSNRFPSIHGPLPFSIFWQESYLFSCYERSFLIWLLACQPSSLSPAMFSSVLACSVLAGTHLFFCCLYLELWPTHKLPILLSLGKKIKLTSIILNNRLTFLNG